MPHLNRKLNFFFVVCVREFLSVLMKIEHNSIMTKNSKVYMGLKFFCKCFSAVLVAKTELKRRYISSSLVKIDIPCFANEMGL